MERRPAFKGSLLVSYSAVAFGLMPILAKFAYRDGANPLSFLAYRFTIAAIILTVIAFFKGENLRLTAKQYLALIGLGVGGYSMVAVCYFTAITKIPTSITALILYTYPIIVTVFAVVSGEEAFERRKAVALVISFAGIALIMNSSLHGLNLTGVLLACASSVFYSMYIIFSNKLLKTVSALATTTFMIWAAAVTLSIAAYVTHNLNFEFGAVGWLSIVGIALISTVSGILTFLLGLELTGPSQASILSTLEPVITVILSFIFFQELLSVSQVIGGGLVLLAVVLMQTGNRV